jgi:two-component system NtrC family sensor kinase
MGARSPGSDRDKARAVRLDELSSALTSLDPAEVIARGLELVRIVSAVERSYLVGAGTTPRLEPLLRPLTDPQLAVSRSSIEKAFATRQKVSLFVNPDAEIEMTRSANILGLRRIWVCPVLDPANAPIAALYLDSPIPGRPFDAEVEAKLELVAKHMGVALRNALLHAEVVELNRHLEEKVAERTRQLEESQARLIQQDRLATLGRLVAAIAHELNNPVGAIASFARTLEDLAGPIRRIEQELRDTFRGPGEEASARRLLERVLAAAEGDPIDTRTRRANEDALLGLLRERRISGAEAIAQRLARAGVNLDAAREAVPALTAHGEALSLLAERLGTFRRSISMIGQCAANTARIVDGLKTYAHLDRSEMEVADIHRGIQAALSVLAPRIPDGIEVVTHFATIAPFLHRPGELTQVWTNLVDNAVRAMGEHGALTVETADLGDRVRVTVADTGPGVPPELRDRIFDLHVTTRGPGAGLGLGLPICRTIVEQNHRGTITFESRPGRTVFTVALPKQPSPGQE